MKRSNDVNTNTDTESSSDLSHGGVGDVYSGIKMIQFSFLPRIPSPASVYIIGIYYPKRYRVGQTVEDCDDLGKSI